MSNPARNLANLFEKWAVPGGQVPEQPRGDGNVNSMIFWDEHRLAMGYLEDIALALQVFRASGQDVSHYEESLPFWCQVIFNVHMPWGRSESQFRPAISPGEMRLLKGLAGHMDSHGVIPVLDGTFFDKAIDSVGKLRKLVDAEPTLSRDLRTYLSALIDATIDALHSREEIGNMAVRRRLMELLGATTTVEQTVPAESRRKWTEQTHSLLLLIFGAIGTKALEVGSAVATQMLTGSSGS